MYRGAYTRTVTETVLRLVILESTSFVAWSSRMVKRKETSSRHVIRKKATPVAS